MNSICGNWKEWTSRRVHPLIKQVWWPDFMGMYNFPLAIQVDPKIYLARSLSLGDLNTNSSEKCYSKLFFYFSQHLEQLSRITKHRDILLNWRMKLLLILVSYYREKMTKNIMQIQPSHSHETIRSICLWTVPFLYLL